MSAIGNGCGSNRPISAGTGRRRACREPRLPSITNSTCNPAAVVPVKVGVLTFVILSMFDAPLSLAAARSGVEFGVVSGFPEFETRHRHRRGALQPLGIGNLVGEAVGQTCAAIVNIGERAVGIQLDAAMARGDNHANVASLAVDLRDRFRICLGRHRCRCSERCLPRRSIAWPCRPGAGTKWRRPQPPAHRWRREW